MARKRPPTRRRRTPPPSQETLDRVGNHLAEVDHAVFGDKPAISGAERESAIRRSIARTFSKSSH